MAETPPTVTVDSPPQKKTVLHVVQPISETVLEAKPPRTEQVVSLPVLKHPVVLPRALGQKTEASVEIEETVAQFNIQEDVTLEIPQPVEEAIVVEQLEETEFFKFEETEPSHFERLSPEIEDEIKQAALLWAEQWGNKHEAELEPQAEEQLSLIELLPIEPEDLPEILLNLPESKLQEAAAILDAVLQTVASLELGTNSVVLPEELAALEQMV